MELNTMFNIGKTRRWMCRSTYIECPTVVTEKLGRGAVAYPDALKISALNNFGFLCPHRNKLTRTNLTAQYLSAFRHAVCDF